MTLPPPAASGSAGIDWAHRTMPLLAATMRKNAKTFAGRHIGICLHIEPKTGVLVQWLRHVGAEVTITGNFGTTDAATAAALTELGATVIGTADDSAEQHAHNLQAVVSATPDLLLDNGAEMLDLVLAGAPRHRDFAGATEETTTGGRRLRESEVPADFPIVVINDSPLKLLIENEFGVGQSIVQGFMNATNRMLPGTRATVIGYGPCGTGVADTLQRLGARVSVVERDPYRALEAIMHGHSVGPFAESIASSAVLFLATGHPDVVSADDLSVLPDGIIIAGVGHEPDEMDLTALAAQSVATVELAAPGSRADARTLYRMTDGREITVLHGTKMINLVAAGGNPIQAMDLGLSLQAASLAAIARGEVTASGPQGIPAAVDRGLATDLVELWR